MKTATHEEFLKELAAQGVPSEHKAFKCPMCGTIQSATSLIRAGAGTTYESVQGQLGFSCVGRHTGAGSHEKGTPPGKGCNYTLGGLFQFNTYEVVADGVTHPLFEPATPAEAQALLEVNKVLGHVEGKPVFKGDVLYVDIRGTSATKWGKGQVASQGADEGQGPMIVFEDGDYRMVDRLLWNPVITVTIPPAILELARQVATQDNRVTSHPVFQVQTFVEHVIDPDHAGYKTRIVWRETESGEYDIASPLRAARLEALFDGRCQTLDGWERLAVEDSWEPVSGFLTNTSAEKYMRDNRYDLKTPRIYVASGHNNAEHRLVRDFLLSIASEK